MTLAASVVRVPLIATLAWRGIVSVSAFAQISKMFSQPLPNCLQFSRYVCVCVLMDAGKNKCFLIRACKLLTIEWGVKERVVRVFEGVLFDIPILLTCFIGTK